VCKTGLVPGTYLYASLMFVVNNLYTNNIQHKQTCQETNKQIREQIQQIYQSIKKESDKRGKESDKRGKKKTKQPETKPSANEIFDCPEIFSLCFEI